MNLDLENYKLKKRESRLKLKNKKRKLFWILNPEKLILKSSLKKKEFKEKKIILLGNLSKKVSDSKEKEKRSGKDFTENKNWRIKENLKSLIKLKKKNLQSSKESKEKKWLKSIKSKNWLMKLLEHNKKHSMLLKEKKKSLNLKSRKKESELKKKLK